MTLLCLDQLFTAGSLVALRLVVASTALVPPARLLDLELWSPFALALDHCGGLVITLIVAAAARASPIPTLSMRLRRLLLSRVFAVRMMVTALLFGSVLALTPSVGRWRGRRPRTGVSPLLVALGAVIVVTLLASLVVALLLLA